MEFNIRKAQSKDIADIVVLIFEFYKESLKEYGISLDIDTLSDKTVPFFLDTHILLVAEVSGQVVGVIGGVIAPSMFDQKQITVQEAIWYVSKEYRSGRIGLKLIQEFETECKNIGAHRIHMAHMSNLNSEVLKKIYESRGYTHMESNYTKEV